MNKYVKYFHYGTDVIVREDMKGRHREHCLCWSCGKFNPGIPEENCPIANAVYALCILEHLTLPVWECPKFFEKEE